MYNDFFGFRERPFSVTLDPCVFYETPTYQRIYNNLVHSILEGKSLTVLTGEVGTGKTTILRRIMRELERFVRFAYFTYTTLPFDDLLDFICEDLEIPRQHSGQLQKLKALQEYLTARHNAGQSAVLLIDEAQNLQETVLEEIRHLMNLTTESKSLLPVILVGQPELERKLALPSLYRLKQRVTIHCQLHRLKERDVAPFIMHRLQAAGSNREDIFTPEAIQHIALYSQGVPRLINILCDNVLLLGYSISQQTISGEMVEEVSQDLGLQSATPSPGEPPVVAREQTQVPLALPLSSTTQTEEQLTTAGPLPVTQSQPPIQLTTAGTVVSRMRPKTEVLPQRTSPRRLIWAGTGLAFALWSLTLLPYGEEPTTPPTSSASSTNKSPAFSDQAVAFLSRPETKSGNIQRETASPSFTTKEVNEEKNFRHSAPIERTEEKKPAPSPLRTENKETSSLQDSLSISEGSQPAAHEPLLIDVASEGNQEETQRLLDAGAAPNVADERGWTALMMATLHGHTSVVRLLLKKGANANLTNSTGGTALMMAALQGQDEILQLLLENGARVDTQDAKGWTALMYAARNGYAPTVEILLSSGAEVNLKNDEGRTALMYATAKGHREAIQVLQNGRAVGSTVN